MPSRSATAAKSKITPPAANHASKRSRGAPQTSARGPIGAAKAKTHFLQLLDDVERNQKGIVITKRGRAVAQLVPVPAEEKKSNFDLVFGSMRGTGKILGDIVSPDWDAWGPEWR